MAVRIGIAGAACGLSFAVLAALLLLRADLGDPLQSWITVVAFALASILAVAAIIPIALLLVSRTVGTLTIALRDLAQRADDFGAGDFSNDEQVQNFRSSVRSG